MEKLEKYEDKIPHKKKLIRAIEIGMRHMDRIMLPQSAAEMTYFILLSIIPIILVIANIIPMLPIATDQVLSIVQEVIPADVYNVLEPTLMGYLEGGSGGAISIGLITALFSASRIVSILNRSLDEIYGTVDKRNFVLERIVSFLIMLGIIALAGLAFFVFIFGEAILGFVQDLLGLDFTFMNIFMIFRWVIVLVLFPLIFLIIYHVLPSHHLELKYSLPGAIFAAIGSIILSEFYTLILRLFGGDAVGNATFGAVIALMLFLYIANMITFIGAMINTFIFEWVNEESVEVYEHDMHRKEQLENTKWKGYPDSNKTLILRHKLYKTDYLKSLNSESDDKVEMNKLPDE